MYQWTYVYGDTLAISIVGTKELWVSISLSGFRKTYETWLKEVLLKIYSCWAVASFSYREMLRIMSKTEININRK